jgi:hypothetical protein
MSPRMTPTTKGQRPPIEAHAAVAEDQELGRPGEDVVGPEAVGSAGVGHHVAHGMKGPPQEPLAHELEENHEHPTEGQIGQVLRGRIRDHPDPTGSQLPGPNWPSNGRPHRSWRWPSPDRNRRAGRRRSRPRWPPGWPGAGPTPGCVGGPGGHRRSSGLPSATAVGRNGHRQRTRSTLPAWPGCGREKAPVPRATTKTS